MHAIQLVCQNTKRQISSVYIDSFSSQLEGIHSEKSQIEIKIDNFTRNKVRQILFWEEPIDGYLK